LTLRKYLAWELIFMFWNDAI